MELIIPGVIVFVGNVFSGSPGSRQWKLITALLGWSAGGALILWAACAVLGADLWARQIFLPIWTFCLLQALSRDYTRLLKPMADRWTKRQNLGE